MSTDSSLEFRTVRGNFVAICRCIADADLVLFAGELFQSELISYAGHQVVSRGPTSVGPRETSHQAAIAVTGISPANKVAHLVSEAMKKVSDSPDDLYKFISILENRNKELAATLRSDYSVEQSLQLDPKQTDPCDKYVTNLQQVYRTAQSPTWDPLPRCQHIKLAMIKEKGKRYGSDKVITESRVEGKVDKVLTMKVPVDSDKIFDAGTFDDERQVILVEGVGGMGKTSLAYQYAKKWSEGMLSTFDAVALVRLRDLNEHVVREIDCILPHLLFLASGVSMSKEVARQLVDKLNFLLILDGWDELPFKNPSFLKELLQSVSPQTKILITSRPDFSLNLHDQANRVEILGFTKSDVHDYFKNAFQSQLLDTEVKMACDKLNDHFQRYPFVEQCCYVPLNAAILAYIYLYRDQVLPVTQTELFQELILCCIARELETRQPNRVLEVSSFKDLPSDLKDQLRKLSELAFNGMMEKKIVFTQTELKSFSTLGLLQSVEGFSSIGRKIVTCNFIHLTVQELLAAYYISQLEHEEQIKKFKHLMTVNSQELKSVLRFYAGLTRLTNEVVQRLLLSRSLICWVDLSDMLNSRELTVINCIFEAQVRDLCYLTNVVGGVLGSMLNLCVIPLNSMDCVALNYFLFCMTHIRRIGGFDLNLSGCGIDDQSLRLLLGTPPETSHKSCILRTFSTFDVTTNNFTDAGIAYIARFLPKTTLKTLAVGNIEVTDEGIVPVLETLSRQQTLKKIRLLWSASHPDRSLEKIGECAKESKLECLDLHLFCPPMPSEAEEDWVQKIVIGGNSLIRQLQYSEVHCIEIATSYELECLVTKHLEGKESLLQKTVKSINKERRKEKLKLLKLYIWP